MAYVTFVLLACEFGHLATVRYLIENKVNKANIEEKTKAGYTALILGKAIN